MKTVKDIIYFFCLLYILFVPVELYLFSFQEKLTAFVFTDAISFTARNIFHQQLLQPAISSDSLALYVLAFLLFLLAVVFAFAAKAFQLYRDKREKIIFLLRTIFCYYLSLQLFIYGAIKIFKAQFYLPEPNILYTPLGFVSRDLLYWSTIGSSYSYSVFLGAIELLAALLLQFRRSRVLGLLMAFALMLHIVAVNFSFDISVKLHSGFLFLLTIFLMAPYAKRLYQFFVLHVPSQLSEKKAVLNISPAIKTGLKTFAVCIILFEAFYPFIKAKQFNDDLAARPYLHGAYQVINDSTHYPSIKRFFIHRDGYLILENDKDEMRDYKVFIDTISHHFLLYEYNGQSTKMNYEYVAKDSLLTLHYPHKNGESLLIGKALNWKEMPAIKNQFHWTVESVH